MHPILARPRNLGLFFAAAAPAAALLAELLARAGSGDRTTAWAVAAPLLGLHAFSCLASWYVCRGLPLATAPLGRVVAAHLLGAIVAGALTLAVGRGWARILAGVLPDAPALFAGGMPLVFAAALVLWSLAVALHYLLIAAAASRDAESRAFEARILAREAELKALRAQVDPHFLFNSLNAVAGLVASSPAEARRMCGLLAGFLRESLRLGERTAIPLGEEVALARRYLEIEAIRFGERLRVEIEADVAATAVAVPPLLLQPLVENAVRHGIAHLLDGGTVRIEAARLGDRLRLAVANPCDADRPRQRGAGGIGLANVRRRLAARWGDDAGLVVEERDGTFRVTATLPIEQTPPVEEAS